MESCCCSINKYLIFLANFVFFALGVAALGIGIFALVDGDALNDFLSVIDDSLEVNVIYAAAVLDIVISSIIVLITFLGCCGAIKVRHKGMSQFRIRISRIACTMLIYFTRITS